MIVERLLPLAVGFAAGIAGAVGLSTALPVSIATVLISAVAVTSIGIAWSEPSVATGEFVLLGPKFVAVNVLGFVTLRAFGYRPTDGDDPSVPTGRAIVFVIAIVFHVVLTGAVFAMQVSFENHVNDTVDDVLAGQEYDDVGLVRTQTDVVVVPGSGAPAVTVVVTRPADRTYPTTANDLGSSIESRTGREVVVTVEFVDRQQYESDGGAPS